VSPILEAHDLTAGYGTMDVVHELGITVEAGEIVALLGPNGAGKSTTLLTLAGEVPARKGEVRLRGHTTKKPLHQRARAGLGLVAEGRGVFPGLSTRDNIRIAGIPEDLVLELFPELEKRLDVRGGLLSGGEQQMLVLGRALARKPSILLADELSLGLAPLIVDRLLQAVRQAADAGTAILLVEQHVRKVLAYADRVYVMRRGRIQLQMSAVDARERIGDIEEAYLTTAA
jgi:branched-chain amino acid transport system ATP-binding protein